MRERNSKTRTKERYVVEEKKRNRYCEKGKDLSRLFVVWSRHFTPALRKIEPFLVSWTGQVSFTTFTDENFGTLFVINV